MMSAIPTASTCECAQPECPWTGNTDPWAGPVDPAAVERELQAWKRRQNPRAAQREQQPCGCWANDCGECGPRRADGKRPAPGSTRASALRSDAMLLQARVSAVRDA